MTFIANRVDTSIDLPAVLAAHAKWAAGDGGSKADLSGANLRIAVLRMADLRIANLSRADLYGANLYGANLSGADLHGGDLRMADLRMANLSRAYLRGADLRGAYLPTGETWEVYLSEVVPQLLLAGERGVESLAAWDKHTWDDCPIHVAFSVTGPEQAPALLRPRIEQFVQFFDAGLISQPTLPELARTRLPVTYKGNQHERLY